MILYVLDAIPRRTTFNEQQGVEVVYLELGEEDLVVDDADVVLEVFIGVHVEGGTQWGLFGRVHGRGG
jgi:hypothetical protein